jgi:hypothetical protein
MNAAGPKTGRLGWAPLFRIGAATPVAGQKEMSRSVARQTGRAIVVARAARAS